MITEVEIAECASYPRQVQIMRQLRNRNYIFGFNGAGKSTIARLLQDHHHPDFNCSTVRWENNHPLDVYLYNRQFIREHFDDADAMKGVFTLGKDAKDAKEKIRARREQQDALVKEVTGGETILARAQTELEQLRLTTTRACWETIAPRTSPFRDAFQNYMGRQDDFFTELLRHRGSTADLQSREELLRRAEIVYGAAPAVLPLLPSIDASALFACEDAPILKTRIVASGDVPIARLIGKLNNSDWVDKGRAFLHESEGICPFCQQGLPPDLAEQMQTLFNEEFEQQRDKFLALVDAYRGAAGDVMGVCERIAGVDNPNLDKMAFEARVEALDAACEHSMSALERKRAELGTVAALASVADTIAEMQTLVDSANEATKTHNATVADLASQRKLLTSQVWKYIADGELRALLVKYDADKKSKEEATRLAAKALDGARSKLAAIKNEVEALQENVTDVHRVLNDINRLLTSFGFRGFSLQATTDGKGYRVVRADGKPARESLSEGERSFITFLYFYHLIGGSHESSGTVTDRVIVFDDPVSSMDSEVLFIVSTLVREVCEAAADPASHIKQVFCFTHNVYFHHEVTFRRKTDRLDAYWMVRKADKSSEIHAFGKENPVKSSYQLLWDEIGEREPSPASVQNNIRRILEYYFQFNGSSDIKRIADDFDDGDPDKRVVLSMVSWLHAGSHTIADDVTFSLIDQDAAAKYLRVFRRIFEVSGHSNHYAMMCSGHMKEQYEMDMQAAHLTGGEAIVNISFSQGDN